MRAASQDKYQGALGTVSFGRGKDKVLIDDESKLPVKFLKPVVDKALVNEEALEIEKMRQQILADALMGEADKAAAALVKQKEDAEAAEKALRLEAPDRERLQVAAGQTAVGREAFGASTARMNSSETRTELLAF